jgi:hypothetical protein
MSDEKRGGPDDLRNLEEFMARRQAPITLTTVRDRLAQLHPNLPGCVSLRLYMTGFVVVHLILRAIPEDRLPWTISAAMHPTGGESLEATERRTLAMALQLLETGEWQKGGPDGGEAGAG